MDKSCWFTFWVIWSFLQYQGFWPCHKMWRLSWSTKHSSLFKSKGSVSDEEKYFIALAPGELGLGNTSRDLRVWVQFLLAHSSPPAEKAMLWMATCYREKVITRVGIHQNLFVQLVWVTDKKSSWILIY
jgi:hypothetical protein